MTGSDYQNYKVWQQSMDLVVNIYQLTKKLPRSEEKGLASQMQRAAVSIPSNIAEGYRRKSKVEFKRYLHFSLGSSAELETQLILTNKIYKLDIFGIIEDLTIIQKMLSALIKSLS